jgi:hypothetical protein
MLVLSTRLSRGDPRQILTEIRGTRHGGAMPVLLLGNGDEAGDLAVDQVLRRPVDQEQLVASISAATRPAGQGGVQPVAAMRRRIEGHYAMVEEGDYFSLLELGHGASAAQVAEAADRLLDEFDPQQLDAELAEEYAGQLAEIREVLAEARAVLTPDALREAYRAELEEAGRAEK